MEVEICYECVTNNLTNEPALKMDGAGLGRLYVTIVTRVSTLMSRREWGLS